MNEISWGDMLLGSMFSFERGRESNMASLSCGAIPLVSAKKVNNGIKAFVSSPAKVIRGGNVISLNNDGDGGAGLAFYQPFDFALDTHVRLCIPNSLFRKMPCFTWLPSFQGKAMYSGTGIRYPCPGCAG